MLREIKEIKLRDIENERDRQEIEQCTTLEQLGLTFEEAVELLNLNNIPLVLREDDKEITIRDNEFQGVEDFMFVHVTRYCPKKSKINSPREAAGRLTGHSMEIDGVTYDYDIPYMRDTVHFTVNAEVNTSHGYLNCDDCRYAVLIPFVDVFESQEVKGEPADMYTINGGPKLTKNSYILCPSDEIEQVINDNPGVTVVGYEGESVRGFSGPFVSTIGYRYSATDAHSFIEQKDSLKFLDILKRNGIESSSHYYSKERNKEMAYGIFEKELRMFDVIVDNDLIHDELDTIRILQQLSQTRPFRYDICDEEQKVYLLARAKEKGIESLEAVIESGSFQDFSILGAAMDNFVRIKAQERDNTQELIELWQGEIGAESPTINIPDILEQFKQHNQIFPSYFNQDKKAEVFEQLWGIISDIEDKNLRDEQIQILKKCLEIETHEQESERITKVKDAITLSDARQEMTEVYASWTTGNMYDLPRTFDKYEKLLPAVFTSDRRLEMLQQLYEDISQSEELQTFENVMKYKKILDVELKSYHKAVANGKEDNSVFLEKLEMLCQEFSEAFPYSKGPGTPPPPMPGKMPDFVMPPMPEMLLPLMTLEAECQRVESERRTLEGLLKEREESAPKKENDLGEDTLDNK